MTSPTTTPSTPRISRTAWLAVASFLGVLATFWVFVRTLPGQRLDVLSVHGSTLTAQWFGYRPARLLNMISIPALVLALSIVMGVALLRRQWLLALELAAFMAAANLTTQVLKYSFHRPTMFRDEWNYTQNSLPSGHTTAAASVAVAALLVAPRAFRPGVAVLAAVGSTLFGYATLAAQWHRPADVVAALLVVVGWAFVVITSMRLRHRSTLADTPPLTPAVRAVCWLLLAGGLIALTVAVVCGVLVWGDQPATTNSTDLWEAYLGGSAGIAGVACLGIAALLRGVTRSPLTND